MSNNFIWILFFVLSVSYSLFGIYIYSRPYLREKANLKQVWGLFGIFCFLKIFDILSTAYFSTRLGVSYEGNIVVRELMNTFGIWGGLAFSTLIFIPYSFFLFLSVNYVAKNGTGWKIFKMIVITIGVLVPIVNLGSVPM